MPRPPYPNAIRAVIGFFGGLIGLVVIVGLFRYFVQGIDAYVIPVKLTDGLFAGGFWEDEATFMFAFLGGALGFLWGAGATYDFPKEEAIRAENSTALARIPVDPDAPRPPAGPVGALLPAIPSLGLTLIAVIVGVVFVLLLTVLPVGTRQTYDNAADRGTFNSEADAEFLGIRSPEGMSKAALFVGFSVIVLGGVITTGLLMAGGLYLLNREIKVTEATEAQAEEGQNFLPIRLAAFFTDWAVDVLTGISAAVRPR